MAVSIFHLFLLFIPLIIPFNHAEKLPLDVNFVKLSQSSIYVDKTKFLLAFFNNKTFHNYITCPRRFGKTTMLRMIKSFAQIEVDKKKKRFYWKDTHAFTVFQNLAIGKNLSFMANHLARYVVITLNLNMDNIKRPTEKKLISFLQQQIFEYYERYKWIANEGYKVDSSDIDYMKKVQNNTLNKLEWNLCLYRLAKILHTVYDNTKVIVLVDDYDSAFTKLVYEPDFEIKKYYQLLNNILSRTYKTGRKYIDYVLMTGTSSMSYYMDLPRIQGIVHRPFLEDHPFVTFFGILAKELTPKLDELDFDEEERFKLKECYNGYTSRLKHRTIYNPNSIRQYLETRPRLNRVSKYWKERFAGSNHYFPKAKEVAAYWTIDDRDFVIFEFLCFYDFFMDISVPTNTENRDQSNFTLSKAYDEDSVHRFIILVKHVLNYLNYDLNLEKKKDIYMSLIRSFAFEHGYFTHSRKEDGFHGVPNCEVRKEVVKRVDEFNARPNPTKFV